MRVAGLVLLLCGVPALFAIDGTVVNQTSGKPQAGATVSLYKLGQAGMEALESVKSDAQGKFSFKQDLPGPRLVQTAFDGVIYNHIMPPGSSSTGLSLDVYNSSKRQPADTTVSQHMMLFEPSGGQLTISESYIFQNSGKITWNDPDGGTLRFYLPREAKGIVQVNCTAPHGMPIQRAADPAGPANEYKVDFPIKPGETRIDLTYLVPYSENATFEGKLLYKGGPTRLVTPNGVTLKGDQITSLGAEPRTQANIYDVKAPVFRISVEGSGSLRQGAEAASEDSGPSIEEIMPKAWKNMEWILALALAILTVGFVVLYRAQEQPQAPGASKGKDGRRRG